MAVTIKDIARICGVSYATVSRALNNNPRINEKTRMKIARVAQSMGYTPNAMARGLVMKRSNTLALLIPDITNPFWPQVAKGVEDFANEQGFQVLLCNTDNDEGKEIVYVSSLLERRVDGIIIAPSTTTVSHLFNQNETPVVYLEVGEKLAQSSYIIFDNKQGAFDGAEYLIKLGHKRIACITGDLRNIAFADRMTGYRNALKQYDIPIDDQLIASTDHFRIEDGYEAALRLFGQEPKPTAVFAFNDSMALGVMQALEELGLSVPDDVSVMGYDDISFASLPKINLTTIRQPQYETGQVAARILIEQIENGVPEQPVHTILKPEISIRKTCNSPKNC